MSIQQISLSNSQKKKLLRSELIESVLFQDDNQDLVVNAIAYKSLKESLDESPIEAIVGKNVLNQDVEYFVFS